MLHRRIEGTQKNKYRIVLIAIMMVLIFIGYKYFIGDKWIQLKNVQAELDLNQKSKELGDYQISKISEYEKKVEELNKLLNKKCYFLVDIMNNYNGLQDNYIQLLGEIDVLEKELEELN